MVELFTTLVTQEEWTTAKLVCTELIVQDQNSDVLWSLYRDLISLMKTCGKMLVTELPLHTSAENMVLRLLKIVRDEYTAACHQVTT